MTLSPPLDEREIEALMNEPAIICSAGDIPINDYHLRKAKETLRDAREEIAYLNRILREDFAKLREERAAVIEECAKVADEVANEYLRNARMPEVPATNVQAAMLRTNAAVHIARSIRALAQAQERETESK